MPKLPKTIKTQAHFDAYVKAGKLAVVTEGYFVASDSASVRASGSASVRAYGNASVRASGSASVRASGSASVTAYGSASVTAYGNASVTASGNASVTAYGNASVTASDSASVRASGSASVRAYGNASVRASGSASVRASGSASVTAYGSASVTAYGNASVRASGKVIIRLLSALKIVATLNVVIVRNTTRPVEIEGGTIVDRPSPATAEEWCEHHGVDVVDGIATLYKGVDGEYRSGHGGYYSPGTVPQAPDWDGGRAECGGGLHFSPRPFLTHQFCRPEKYVACPVALADMRAPQADDTYPTKIKAAKCAGPVWECDEDGAPVQLAAAE